MAQNRCACAGELWPTHVTGANHRAKRNLPTLLFSFLQHVGKCFIYLKYMFYAKMSIAVCILLISILIYFYIPNITWSRKIELFTSSTLVCECIRPK